MSITTINPQINQLEGKKSDEGDQVPQDNLSYIIKIQTLVAQILVELGRVAANNHASLEKTRREYLDTTLGHSHLQTKSGQVSRNLSIASVFVSCLQLFLQNGGDRQVIEVLSQQIPSLGGFYTADIQAQMYWKNQVNQLTLDQWRQTIQNLQQLEGGTPKEFQALLDAVAQIEINASRGSS